MHSAHTLRSHHPSARSIFPTQRRPCSSTKSGSTFSAVPAGARLQNLPIDMPPRAQTSRPLEGGCRTLVAVRTHQQDVARCRDRLEKAGASGQAHWWADGALSAALWRIRRSNRRRPRVSCANVSAGGQLPVSTAEPFTRSAHDQHHRHACRRCPQRLALCCAGQRFWSLQIRGASPPAPARTS